MHDTGLPMVFTASIYMYCCVSLLHVQTLMSVPWALVCVAPTEHAWTPLAAMCASVTQAILEMAQNVSVSDNVLNGQSFLATLHC